jgi:hypothetical protein
VVRVTGTGKLDRLERFIVRTMYRCPWCRRINIFKVERPDDDAAAWIDFIKVREYTDEPNVHGEFFCVECYSQATRVRV